jgi:thioredoxin 1
MPFYVKSFIINVFSHNFVLSIKTKKAMLYTNLKHIETDAEHNKIIKENENVMVCCGRMGPMCIPVYGVMEELEKEYTHVQFFDMEFDNPESYVIRNAPECASFHGLPYVVYYKNGKLVKATTSIQSMNQMKSILDKEFSIVNV